MSEVFNPGGRLSLKMPVAGLVKGSPVRVGGATGINGVLTSDPTPASQTPTDNIGPVTGGGNPVGYASVDLQGVHEFTVTGAAALYGPVYIDSDMALTTTASGNTLFGVAMDVKSAGSGTIPVLIK